MIMMTFLICVLLVVTTLMSFKFVFYNGLLRGPQISTHIYDEKNCQLSLFTVD